MKKLFRLISINKLEVYHLNRRGELKFHEAVDLKNVKLRQIKYLLVSANFTNWDTTQIENVAYKPRPNTNLFSSKSLFKNENLVTTDAHYNEQTGYWAQAWTSHEKLNAIWKIISKRAVIYPEALNIVCKEDAMLWQSGPCLLSFSKETGFSHIFQSNENDPVTAKTLEGFLFSPKVGFQKKRQKGYSSLFWCSVFLLVSLTFSWQYSFKSTVNLIIHPPTHFENTLTSLPLLQRIQNEIPDGALLGIELNQREKAATLTFLSDETAQRFFKKIESITNFNEHMKVEKIKNTIVLSVRVTE